MKSFFKRLNFSLLDFIPAISGLIGKIALVSSFAFVWAQELKITAPNFVFDNVRLEVIIGSLITLLAAFVLPDTAPAGTLAPLIVLIPAMAGFGVHPFVLSIMVGLAGIISVKTKLFEKLILISGFVSKTSLSLVFGISGVLLSAEKLLSFFGGRRLPLLLLLLFLAFAYILLLRCRKNWLIIPVAAVAALLLPMLFGIRPDTASAAGPLVFDPSYWWKEMWGTGFGFNAAAILKTLPFAIFVILLWAVDTVSINALLDANFKADEKKEEMDVGKSFLIVSARNMIGGLYGGAQTGSLWRSFLIPLFMMKRPIAPAAVLLGILGVIAGIAAVPIKILSFPPLIWTVLLFGIFIPFIGAGIKNMKSAGNLTQKGMILFFSAAGVLVSPILTWIGAVCFEKIEQKLKKSEIGK